MVAVLFVAAVQGGAAALVWGLQTCRSAAPGRRLSAETGGGAAVGAVGSRIGTGRLWED